MRNRRSTSSTIWKRGLTALALAGSTLLATLPASAQGISVYVDGDPVNFDGVPPTSQGGRLLVPLRGVFEALGAVVEYDAVTRTIEALRGDTRLRLTLGSTTAYVNDQPVRLEVPAQKTLGRTMVPLRFVGQAFGALVNWNPADRSVIITSPLRTDPDPIPVATPRPTPVPTPTPIPAPIPDPIPIPIDPQPKVQTVSGTIVSMTSGQAGAGRITIRTRNVDQTYNVQRNAVMERRPLLNRSTMTNPEFGTTTTIAMGDVRVGEMVELTFNDNNRVTRIVAMPSVSVVRVLSATGNRIILDDGRESPLTIGANLRYINLQGREASTTNLRRGDEVVVFVSPETRRVYQISAFRNDLDAAYGREVKDGFLPPADDDDDDDDVTPGGNTGRADIESVSFTTSNRAGVASNVGDIVTVTVRGTPGLRGSVDLSRRAVNIPLRERPRQPGIYTATYTIKRGDDVTNGRITARLFNADGDVTTQESQQVVTIDTDNGGIGGNDGEGAITSIFHNANRTLEAGERVIVEMVAESGGRASFDLVNEDDRVVARDIPMTEARAQRGRYRGEYVVQGVRDAGELRIIGRFRDVDGQTSTLEATTTVEVGDDLTGNNLDAPTITFPTEDDTVQEQITIRGRGTAGSTMQISVRAEGTQYFVVPYSVEVPAPTARVRNNGTWETAPITLPRPRNVTGLRYVISATQTDNADRESEATTVTVRAEQ